MRHENNEYLKWWFRKHAPAVFNTKGTASAPQNNQASSNNWMSLSIKVLKCVFRTDGQKKDAPALWSIFHSWRFEGRMTTSFYCREQDCSDWSSLTRLKSMKEFHNVKQKAAEVGWRMTEGARHLYLLSPHPQFMMIGHRGLMMYYEYLTLKLSTITPKLPNV